jgi:hypothetical protein
MLRFNDAMQLAHQGRQAFGFVENGDDDREHGRRRDLGSISRIPYARFAYISCSAGFNRKGTLNVQYCRWGDVTGLLKCRAVEIGRIEQPKQ